jgi:hypothetical protein
MEPPPGFEFARYRQDLEDELRCLPDDAVFAKDLDWEEHAAMVAIGVDEPRPDRTAEHLDAVRRHATRCTTLFDVATSALYDDERLLYAVLRILARQPARAPVTRVASLTVEEDRKSVV